MTHRTTPSGGALAALLIAAAVMLAAPGDADAVGMLIPTDQSLPPLAIKNHRVNINITDQAAVTRVEQEFINHTDRQLEATFIFPVPAGATVSDFALWINGVKTNGAVLERDKAREIYEGIVRRTQDPGLVEYMDGTLFQARIFPVPARGVQKVEIAFAQILDKSGSIRRLLYPLKTGRSSARLMEDFTIVADISSRSPIKTVYSPSHKLSVSRKSDHRVVASVEEMGADLERDFLLYMSTDDDDIGMTVLSFDDDGQGGDDGYYMMVLTPSIEVDEEKLPGKAVTFVVDTSGSMAGEKMEQARQALKYCVNKLRPKDRFNIVRFSTDVELLFGNPVEASADNVKRGLAFADNMEAAGGTAIDEALIEALKARVDPSLANMVIFMTDGRPTVGSTDINEIITHTKSANSNAARIFTFGVGFEVNTLLLDTIASDHNGQSDYIRPQEDIEVKVSALYNKIAYPVLTDIQIDVGEARVYDVYPRKMPDLFRGGQVVVLGRNRAALPATFKMTGRVGDKGVTMTFGEERGDAEGEAGSPTHDFIPKIWATRKVGYLLDEIRARGEVAELRDEVIRLARKYGLVTPYTSYLAVDDSELEQQQPPPISRRFEDGDRFVPEGAPLGGRDLGGGGGEGGGRGSSVARDPAPRNSGGLRAPAKAMEPSADEAFDAPVMRGSADKTAKKADRERVLKEKDAFASSSGEQAVESSIATEDLKQADSQVDSGALRSRFVSGRLFLYSDGAWRQEGLGAPTVKIKYFSEAYFDLLKARPEVQRFVSLGRRIVLKVGGQIVEIGPDGEEKLSVEKIRKW